MVKVPFFNNAKMEGGQVTTATSDENGKVEIYGLAYGSYYLLETKSPVGYNLSEGVKKITIKGKSSVKAGKKLKLKATVKTTKGKANKKLKWTTSTGQK